MPVPLHCTLCGTQAPVQVPAEQAWPGHGVGVPHIPLESHVCTP
jgi:hypothetical protein